MPLRKEAGQRPHILQVKPSAGIPGGELRIHGSGFTSDAERPLVTIGDSVATVMVGSSSFVVAKVPESASAGDLVINNRLQSSDPYTCDIGIQMTDGVHPVGNPAVDSMGNVYTTLSGSRGQKTPVSVYKIDLNHAMKPFVAEIMNATGLAFDRDGQLYVSSRYDGIIYRITPAGAMTVFCEGMGVATGLAFDAVGNLFVGDRSGTIFKISPDPDRQIYVFATIEASIAAYHLACGPDGYLYVTGPTTGYDSVQRISSAGEVETFYRGLGRPQGLAFDQDGRLYVAASIQGSRGVVRIDADGQAELFVSGPHIVGVALSPTRDMILTTNNSVYRVNVDRGPLKFW
jgi:IPT/TIG domain